MKQPYREATINIPKLKSVNYFKKLLLALDYRIFQVTKLFLKNLFGGKYMSYPMKVFCWCAVCYVALAGSLCYTFNFNNVIMVWGAAILIVGFGIFKAATVQVK